MIEQTRFLSTVFLCSEFKLENIYSGVNFCGKNVCGNFYLRELIFTIAGKTAKNAKIRTRKNFVPHGKYVPPHRVGFLCLFAESGMVFEGSIMQSIKKICLEWYS